MTTNYPTSQDSFSRPTASSALTGHAALHDDIADAVESIENVVGLTGGTSGAVLFKTATIRCSIAAGASGYYTPVILNDPHNMFSGTYSYGTGTYTTVEADNTNFYGITFIQFSIVNYPHDMYVGLANTGNANLMSVNSQLIGVSGGSISGSNAAIWFVGGPARFYFSTMGQTNLWGTTVDIDVHFSVLNLQTF